VAKIVKKTRAGASGCDSLLYEKGKKAGFFKIVFNPFWAFFTSYFLRAGFLDWFNGFVIALHIGHLTFLKYIKLFHLIANKK